MTSKPSAPPQPELQPHAQPQEPLPALFEAALAELEALVQAMERPGVALETLLQGYQRGVALSQFCQQKLSHVQGEVDRLSAASQAAMGGNPEVGGV